MNKGIFNEPSNAGGILQKMRTALLQLVKETVSGSDTSVRRRKRGK